MLFVQTSLYIACLHTAGRSLELERHIHSRDNNLSKIHRQVMNSTETKADALKNEPIIIRKIKRDYDRIQVLADEKVQIAEQALKLVSEGMVNICDLHWV